MGSRNLDDLSSELRPLADALLVALIQHGVEVRVISILRTMEEHRVNLRKGTSSAMLSFHLPRSIRMPHLPMGDPDYMKSDALDLVLITARKAIWDTKDPRWHDIGFRAESLGLEWGGRWKKPYDPGHVQLPRLRWSR